MSSGRPVRPGASGRSRTALAGAALGLALACGDAGDRGRPEPISDEALVRADARIAAVLGPCPDDRVYDRSQADLLPALLEKLERGRAEPLRRAKEELGAMGAESAEALRRFFERHASDQMSAPYVQNALDAAALNPSDEAHDVLLRAIEHPQETVRQHALLGILARHARPEDFERLLAHTRAPEVPVLRSGFARALFAADRPRAEDLALAWIAAGEREEHWLDVVPLVARSERATIAAAAAALAGELPAPFDLWLSAPAARFGDEAAVQRLRAALADANPSRRTLAVHVLDLAGRRADLVPALRSDPDAEVRALAVEAIAKGTEDEVRGWLREALEDRSPIVRSAALARLAARGDAAALERALTQLGGGAGELQEALVALREPMRVDPELARRVWSALRARHEAEAHRPLAERTATMKAIGIVPFADAARFLREAGRAKEGGRIEGLRAHQWLLIQAANTGAAGRAYLRAELERERDPLRRLDLLWAASADRGAQTRAWLLDFVEAEGRSPYEILFAARQLVEIGPSTEVAPRLKRLSNRIEAADARSALRCLLWAYY